MACSTRGNGEPHANNMHICCQFALRRPGRDMQKWWSLWVCFFVSPALSSGRLLLIKKINSSTWDCCACKHGLFLISQAGPCHEKTSCMNSISAGNASMITMHALYTCTCFSKNYSHWARFPMKLECMVTILRLSHEEQVDLRLHTVRPRYQSKQPYVNIVSSSSDTHNKAAFKHAFFHLCIRTKTSVKF